MIKVDAPIAAIKGVGDKVSKLYKRLNVKSVEDLIYHFPRRYEDYSRVTPIKSIKPGVVTLKVQVASVNGRYARRGLHITEALVKDDTGSIKLTWFNQPYRAKALKQKVWYYVSGEYTYQGDRYSIVNPSMEQVSSFPKNTARIVPIYPETKGLKSHQIRKHITELMPQIRKLEETLPEFVIKDQGLLAHAEAVENLHFPKSGNQLEGAKARIGFEELYEISLASALNKQAAASKEGPSIPIDEQLARDYVQALDYKLTDAQRKSAWQILKDMASPEPMNRLLEGDVGSGKSVVAGLAALMAIKGGYQTVYMAPTEILARQQYEDLGQMLSKFGVKSELLIGSLNAKQRSESIKSIKSGQADFVVGTHALIQDGPVFKKLGLVIVDEQHRFGVKQREKLMGKAKTLPHVLTMTATPIPRSLALTLYGELDVSIIDQLPPGRKPVKTKIVNPASRQSVYAQIEEQLQAGRQGYVICPLVDDSDKLGVKSVTEEFKRLDTGPFKQRAIGLLHGKLKSEEKERIMAEFVAGKLDLLVATTVVEVGVNVANATVMLIEGAERFGLAQLHQLRGRIRRSKYQPYCFLMPSAGVKPARRLRAMETTNDGFKLAELDLELRGPGQIYGVAQSGELDLRLANLRDIRLVKAARDAAFKTLEERVELIQYPRLQARLAKLRKITNLN